jgi:hypothetical protein
MIAAQNRPGRASFRASTCRFLGQGSGVDEEGGYRPLPREGPALAGLLTDTLSTLFGPLLEAFAIYM